MEIFFFSYMKRWEKIIQHTKTHKCQTPVKASSRKEKYQGTIEKEIHRAKGITKKVGHRSL